jgi:hypothetical protein
VTALDVRPGRLRRLLPNWRWLLAVQPAEGVAPAPQTVTSAVDEGGDQASTVYRSEQHEPGQVTTAIGRHTAEHLIVRPDDGGRTQNLSGLLAGLSPQPAAPSLSALEQVTLDGLNPAEALIYNRLAERWRLAPADEAAVDHTGDIIPLTVTQQPEEGA